LILNLKLNTSSQFADGTYEHFSSSSATYKNSSFRAKLIANLAKFTNEGLPVEEHN